MTFSITPEQITWFRLQRSGLVAPFASPEAAASALVGVQAQILPAAGVSLWQRTEGLTYAQFEQRLYQDRTLVKIWGQRGTLHLYPSTEWPLMNGALSPQKTWWERRSRDLGLTAVEYQAIVAEAATLLKQKKRLGRKELRASTLNLHEELFSSWGGIFSDLVRQGHACHAQQSGNEGLFADRKDWLPHLLWQPPDSETANREILRRYLRTYGPSSLLDFAYWRGAYQSTARPWWTDLRDEMVEVDCNGRSLWLLRADLDTLQTTPPPVEAWPVRLLYRFEPLLLGHKDKAWLLDMAFYNHVWRPAGHIEGVLFANGRIQATWRYDRQGNALLITVRPFAPLPPEWVTAVHGQAAGLAQFFAFPEWQVVFE